MTNQELMKVAGMSETSERVLRMIAERRRNTVYTAFSGLRADLKKRDGKEVDRKDFDATFRKLEEIKAGKVKHSKRGAMVGFQWTVPVRQIATLIRNRDEVVHSVAFQNAVAAKTDAETNGRLAREKEEVTLVILRKAKKPETVQVPASKLKELGM